MKLAAIGSIEERWEFVGNIAKDIREKYINKSIAHLFKHGNQSPVVYVNIKGQ